MDAFADGGDPLNFGGGRAVSKDASVSNSVSNNETYDDDHPQNNTSMEIFLLEWVMFKSFWDRALHIYQPIEIGVIALGLFGNILALLTLLRSRRMNSPSFIYHRVLVGADLVFCITYFVHMLIRNALSISCNTTFYRVWFGAYFTGTINPAISHICGYVIMYMTLFIAVDRFLALMLFEKYRHWNTKKVAYAMTVLTCSLSVCLHCWAYFAHGTVVEFRLTDALDTSKSIISKPCWTSPSVVYHWTKRDNVSHIFRAALRAKDYYNGGVRVGYPICLCVLTLGVLISFAKRQKKRRRESSLADPSSFVQAIPDTNPTPVPILKRSMTSASSALRKISTLSMRSERSGSILSSVFSFGFSVNGSLLQNRDRTTSPSVRHRQRCERALFYLMISVVLLAFLQVASSESRRILSLIFPPDEVFKRKVIPSHVPMAERVASFRFLLYGHQATRILANFCTAIDRSFICFLYIAMNNLFRRELVSMLNGVFYCVCARCFPQRAPSMAQRQDSDRRSQRAPVEARSSVPLLVPPSTLPPPTPTPSPSPSPMGNCFPGTLPSATDRGFAHSRFLGESMNLLENAVA